MRQKYFRRPNRGPFARTWILLGAAAFFLLALQVASAAQHENDTPTKMSDLAMRNMARVAASPAEIKSLLLGNGGLMVELKRWVAKDASDHGQMVIDSDLTDEAIFDRLETDVQFRSLATALVQRYGYLLPKVNPDSDPAKEHALLIQERTKWIAQRQEEELALARQRKIHNTGTCDPQRDADCDSGTAHQGSTGQESHSNASPSITNPGQPDPTNSPTIGEDNLIHAQLLRPGQNIAGESSPIPNLSSLQAVSLDLSNPLSSRYGRASPTAGLISNDGLLAAYGNETGTNATALASPSEQPDTHVAPQKMRQSQEMIRKLSPYDSIPSLYDMYVQAVARPATPRRFGAEVFEKGAQDSQSIPMDLPAGPDYVVGPGDALSIDLWGGVSQRLSRTVDREGRVSLPEVGPILVSGKSLAAVQQNLQQILRTQFRAVSADVSLARLRTIRVYEVGDVANPGAYDISSLSTPLNALFSAGGPTAGGSMRLLKHYRGTQLVQTVDVYDLLLHGVKVDLQRLENGDTVQVPPIGPQVTIEGMVRRPAIYELRDEKTLANVLELAGGLLPAAALRHIEVQRLVSHEKQTMLSVDIPEDKNTADATKQLEAFEIHDGDRIRIFPIAPYNQDTIYVEGHVVRPGRYSFRANMRVSDVISSYKDLLPEPASRYAEIIRLNAPDFHPSVEGFDLADALANPSRAPLLHAMDTLRIFSRYDFENLPTVSVLGDVRLPGTYQTSGEIRLADAVHLAGGLEPDAQTVDAQVFRYLPDGKFKIFSVSLSEALGGDPVENILLQPRDRLLIHKSPDAVEPATVYKHVPMMEFNVQEAVKNNVLALLGLLDLADQAGCRSFVMISSDKAVNPTSVMGATKRICELILSSHPSNGMRCVSVRFGNVLGSSGSVIPVLKQQLRNHQPLTVTHPDIRRFFMITREAVALVLQAFVIGNHGEILVLDMGEPIRIVDLARNLIRLSGKSEQDVEIQFTGLREGEKVEEELFYQHEKVFRTSCEDIKQTSGSLKSWSVLCRQLDELRALVGVAGAAPIRAKMKEIVPEYCYEQGSRLAPGSDTETAKPLEKAVGQKL